VVCQGAVKGTQDKSSTDFCVTTILEEAGYPKRESGFRFATEWKSECPGTRDIILKLFRIPLKRNIKLVGESVLISRPSPIMTKEKSTESIPELLYDNLMGVL